MHEASLMKDLMRRIDDVAVAENAGRVVRVAVWLGALSHMSADHFTEHFQHAAPGTRSEGASLDITVSTDIDHPNAQDLLLQSIEVDT